MHRVRCVSEAPAHPQTVEIPVAHRDGRVLTAEIVVLGTPRRRLTMQQAALFGRTVDLVIGAEFAEILGDRRRQRRLAVCLLYTSDAADE